MGFVGRKLKQKSIKAQSLWSDTMSQVEETLGGLRIIKAFCAEEKMNRRFDKINSEYRENIRRVNTRQQMAHPMSEFLGTVMIVIVLWFGGTLVLAEYPVISGPTFIYYLVILYSIINPLKDFSKASYNIPKGLASMERVDKILKAEVEIQEKAQPEHISSFEHEIEFRHVSFAYNDHGKQGGAPELHYVLRDINLVIPKARPSPWSARAAAANLRSSTSFPATTTCRRARCSSMASTSRTWHPRPAPAHRQRQPRGHPLQRHLPQQHLLWRGGSHGRRDHPRGKDRQRPRLHHAERPRLRHQHRRPWRQLSGGQRQLLALAKLLLIGPELLLLDEPTKGLDLESRRIIARALRDHAKAGGTVIMATHDLDFAEQVADDIAMMFDGEIACMEPPTDFFADNVFYRA